MAEKDKLIEIVGPENLFDDPETLKEYSWDYSFVPPRRPSYVIKPESAEEVQRIVKWANEDRMPLVPVSSGPPRFHGDTVPSLGGSVVVDLGRMNEIITISRRNKVAIIEPGVTFSQLMPELKKNGLRPYMPLLPRRTKSALVSALEREPILMPRYHWDMLDPLVCVEVVFGTGDVLRTGEAAIITDREELKEGTFTSPMGPGQFDPARLIQGAQGTFGIVSWGILRCDLLPRLQRLFFVPSEKLEALTEFAYRLLRRRLGEEIFLLSSFSFANVVKEKPEEIKELSLELPPWILALCIVGYERFPEKRVEYQEKDIRDIAEQFGVELLSSISGVGDREVLKILESLPERYWKLRYKGCFQDIPFLTTLDRTPAFINAMLRMVEAHKYPSTELGVYIQPVLQGIGCHCEFNLMYNPVNEGERERIKEVFIRAAENLVNLGAFFSRPYGFLADLAYRRDAETTSILRKAKGIFDPNCIMNPGKLCL